ncbi:MAG: bifunctional 4-hydroxy-2-oxoglutarate aldolase/2-dehydro-3-deoxy-phosphogluconate aldolase [Spirochaetia bacterium]|nr:bifunctional 4-hydroxy-2-oxoglutarate aldolase/2-dehydro-3-deoxy-phosphogluconate aldolase [Spirochaetia bacterium]
MIMPHEIEEKIKKAGIIAVLVMQEEKHIRPTIEALLEGGVTAIELTLRTHIAIEAIKIIHREYPQILLGAGTILTPRQVNDVKEAGADFGVTPGLNRKVMNEALSAQLPFAPGVATPSDIESALEYDCRILKFFPAEPMGGLPYLKSMHAPYAHLGLSFIPLGGINQQNLPLYAKESSICGIGGSWIASKKLISEQRWDKITEQAQTAMTSFFKEGKNGRDSHIR